MPAARYVTQACRHAAVPQHESAVCYCPPTAASEVFLWYAGSPILPTRRPCPSRLQQCRATGSETPRKPQAPARPRQKTAEEQPSSSQYALDLACTAMHMLARAEDASFCTELLLRAICCAAVSQNAPPCRGVTVQYQREQAKALQQYFRALNTQKLAPKAPVRLSAHIADLRCCGPACQAAILATALCATIFLRISLAQALVCHGVHDRRPAR